MSEFKDPKIKLFGKTIQVPDNSAAAAAAAAPEAGESVSGQSGEAAGEDSFNQDPSCTSDSVFEDSNFNRDAEEQQSREILSDPPKQEDHPKEESKDSIATQSIIDDPNEPSTEQDQSDSQQDKTPKKPDKIIPCPRCNSMETKFCYFNNYNVNQPRHFCKNCQRYWTAGGTMRNVPVGAGRRKNKNNVPQFRHLIVPEALPNGTHHPYLNPNNGTVLTFGSDSSTPLCESMSSVLNISRNGPHKPEEQDDGAACKTVSNYQLPTYPVAPLPYPWNPVQWTNHMPPPGMRFPVPFYSTGPPPYWACAVPGPQWSVPWVVPPPSSGPISPTLGKHSRDENVPEGADKTESKSEKCLWFPKTLRIDDPGEAAKSSIWATLGIKNDGVDSVVGGGLFESFVSQSKVEEKSDHVPETSAVLQANPAAFSRSVNFHETS